MRLLTLKDDHGVELNLYTATGLNLTVEIADRHVVEAVVSFDADRAERLASRLLSWVSERRAEQAARAFAVAAHRDQKYGDVPYVAHLDEVHALASDFDAPPDVRVAAYLHDVLEDTSAGPLNISDPFGTDVLRLVQAVTNGPGKNRAERHASTYPKIREHGPHAVLLKLCDRIANVRASVREAASGGDDRHLRMYLDEHEAFRTTLRLPGEHETEWALLDSMVLRCRR